MEKVMSSCGLYCDECEEFTGRCQGGCPRIKGQVWWASSAGGETCPLYSCAVKHKVHNCGQCSEFICKLIEDMRDPSITEKEHKKSIEARRAALDKFNKQEHV